MKQQSSSDLQRNNNDQAALIFQDAIHRPEVQIMREIVPALDLMVIMELLHGNEFDLERSIDAALALLTSLSAEHGRAILSPSKSISPSSFPARTYPSISTANKLVNDGLQSFSQPRSSSSFKNATDKKLDQQRNPNLRGVTMVLSETFLTAPRFRMVIDKHTNVSTNFTVYFRRKSDKIGMTIQEQNTDIVVHTLHKKSPKEPLLALESGIKVGDILTGINMEFFCPCAEVHDVIDILHLTGSFVMLHFTRRHMVEDLLVGVYLSPYHKFAQMLMDQTIITRERAGFVTKAISQLKERILRWDNAWILQRIDDWNLDVGLNLKTIENDKKKCDTACNRSIRPAVSARLLRAEERTDHVVYVIWVMDVKSGAEWFVRRRFREFYDLRDVLVSIRPGISSLEFPAKRLNVAEIGAMVSERLDLLQKFLRKISSLVCLNSFHPSTTKIQLVLQSFLEVTDRMENINYLECKVSFQMNKSMVQVFVHSVMQMPVMDKVLSGFVDTLYDSISDDKQKWSEVAGKKVLNSMKDFLDNLGVVLYEALLEDCSEIMRKFSVDVIKGANDSHGSDKDVTANSSYDRNEHYSDKITNRNDDNNPTKEIGNVNTNISNNSSSSNNNTNNCNNNSQTDISGYLSRDSGRESNANAYNSGDYIQTLDANTISNGHRHDPTAHHSAVASTQHSVDLNLFDFDVDVAKCSSGKGILTPEEAEITRTMNFLKVIDLKEKGLQEGIDLNLNRVKDLRKSKEKERLNFLEQCHDDEMRTQIRSALRRQVEIEVFVPCSARLRVVLGRSFSLPEISLRRNILKIKDQPQSFFGIPVHQISPSSWDEVVFLMRDIRSKTLPHDRLEALLLTAKEIPKQFIREHPHTEENKRTLGADDFLPIFIYILARAQIPDLLALTEELQGICDPDKRMSETGYYLATLEASLQHIIEADVREDQKFLFPMLEKEKNDSDTESDKSDSDDSDDSDH